MKYIFYISFLLIPAISSAQSEIIFPIKELGDCSSKSACKIYCDRPANMEVCLNFAAKHKMLTSNELRTSKKAAEIIISKSTPGECSNREECAQFCENPNNAKECRPKTVKHGFLAFVFGLKK